MYRIFIDEFGHDNLNTSDDPREQYLALTGVVLDLETAHVDLTERMNAMKLRAFGHIKVVFHRREIIDQRPHPFTALASTQVRNEFNDGLLGLIRDVDYRAISVLIDKKEHKERYKVWRFQPYHYCLTAMMERYVMLLDGCSGIGDVMVEWRGIKPNRKLEAAYSYIYRNGTDSMKPIRFAQRLSSSQLKIQKKEANIAGLQLADLLANPASRDLICKKKEEEMQQPFGKQIVEILYAAKYHRNRTGQVRGCGTKTLP